MADDDLPDSADGRRMRLVAVLLFALLLRSAVSLHSYSGAGRPPMYGDFEAQRHWMEMTVSLPADSWYRNSSENPMGYWGLDYPPLTAYQSLVHGLLLRRLHPPSVALVSSRGHESPFGYLKNDKWSLFLIPEFQNLWIWYGRYYMFVKIVSFFVIKVLWLIIIFFF